ncbi:MAG: hypothetical protein H0V19_01235, partial [Euzebyales bacterium]|nr:hypothetical protein [Euzebyales bacterium]
MGRTQAVARIPPRLSTERLGWTIDDELTLQPSAASPRAARQFVVAVLRRWGCEHLGDTVALLTSELVTNAVLHAGSAVGVSVARRRGGVRVEVS